MNCNLQGEINPILPKFSLVSILSQQFRTRTCEFLIKNKFAPALPFPLAFHHELTQPEDCGQMQVFHVRLPSLQNWKKEISTLYKLLTPQCPARTVQNVPTGIHLGNWGFHLHEGSQETGDFWDILDFFFKRRQLWERHMVKRKGGGNRTLHHLCGCLVARSKMNAIAHLGAANCVEIWAHFSFCVPLAQPHWWVPLVLPLFSHQVQLSSDSKPC